MLWDKLSETIVSNEPADIVRMLNSAFAGIVEQGPDLYPGDLATKIDALNAYLYTDLNNGVYQAGFASSQQAYDEAYRKVIAVLDELEFRLASGRPCLFGDRLMETDLRLFVTLVRFNVAYYGLFKCNRNTLRAVPVLYAYMQRIMTLDGIADTVHLDHIKTGCYSIKALNLSGIVPVGPGEN